MFFWKWKWKRIKCFVLGHSYRDDEHWPGITLKWCEYCDWWEIEGGSDGTEEEVQAR